MAATTVDQMAQENRARERKAALEGLPAERGGITRERALECALALDVYNEWCIDGFDPDCADDMASYILGRPCKWGLPPSDGSVW